MKIVSVGGGPAALYFSLLLKRRFPQAELEIHEKNKADDTFGFGVVFSRETLGNLLAADEVTHREIEKHFVYWDDIETWRDGQSARSTGHGFCGLARRDLLLILQRRCAELGVTLKFESDVKPEALPAADLILAADGVHSLLRESRAEVFKPSIDWRKCKFTWLGTTLPLKAFTFWFNRTPWGLFQVHAYPFRQEAHAAGAAISTFIVECREETWRRAGLDKMSEAESVAFLGKVFERELAGHALVANKSIWRTFPTVRCERWIDSSVPSKPVVLMGDAAHTAHFSIGSGTKLAMEDAIALDQAFGRHGLSVEALPRILVDYERERHLELLRLQRAAQTSLEWFENSERYFDQPIDQFTFNLMTRSRRITWANLRTRDPALVSSVDALVAKTAGSTPKSDGSPPPPVFAPLTLKGITLPNRICVSPMCQYVAREGVVDEWHLVHLGSRAVGGAGLVLTEMTDVSAEGRISYGCAGIWNDAQVAAWKKVTDFVHAKSPAVIGLQLAHAGRKASCQLPWEGDGPLGPDEKPWQTLGPSAVPFAPGWHTPKEMDEADLARVKAEFVAGAKRADAAGFDLIELHAAHGYLLSSFLSPLSNRRTDGYGGSLKNRLRYPLEVFDAVRAVWPASKPLAVRISASDWLGPDGLTIEDAIEISFAFKQHGADLIDVSSAGNVPESRVEYGRMYQVPFADAIRHATGATVMSVGGIQGADHANTIIAAGRADVCAMAKAHLTDPYLTHRHAQDENVDTAWWPDPYGMVAPRAPKR